LVVNETIPLEPDTTLTEDDASLSEPIEVGPYEQGIVFVSIIEATDDAAVDVEVAISPTGYEDWDAQWTTVDSADGLDETGMNAIRLSNFGNWIRLRSRLARGEEATIAAWFVGKG